MMSPDRWYPVAGEAASQPLPAWGENAGRRVFFLLAPGVCVPLGRARAAEPNTCLAVYLSVGVGVAQRRSQA